LHINVKFQGVFARLVDDTNVNIEKKKKSDFFKNKNKNIVNYPL